MSNKSPSLIFEGEVRHHPWLHTVSDKLDENLRLELLDYLKGLDWDGRLESEETRIYGHNISTILHTQPPKNQLVLNFLSETLEHDFHCNIAKYYGLDTNFSSVTCVVDKCAPTGWNNPHTDLKFSKNCITLQYYISVEDTSQQILLSGVDTGISHGHGFMFKSSIDTLHSFNQGTKERYSVRIRIRYDLVDPTKLYNESDDDISVIIDCKDMETGWNFEERLEECLGNITYHSALDAGFTNIVLFKNKNDFHTAINTTKTNKVLILFAGGLVSEKTYQWAKSASGQWGNRDSKIILRQFYLFEKDKLKGELQNQGKYMAEQYEYTNFIKPKEIDLFYKHPDEENKKYIIGLIFPRKIDKLGKDKYRLQKLMNK